MGRMLTLSEATGRFLGLYGLVALACLILSQRAGVSIMDVASAYIFGVPALGLSLLHLIPKSHRWALRITHRWGIRLLFAKLNFGWFLINLLFIADGFESDIIQMSHTNEGLLKGFLIFAAPAIYFVMLFPIGLSYRAQRIRREAAHVGRIPKHRAPARTRSMGRQKALPQTSKAWGGKAVQAQKTHVTGLHDTQHDTMKKTDGAAWRGMSWLVLVLVAGVSIDLPQTMEVIPSPAYLTFVQRYVLLLLVAIFALFFLPPLRSLQGGSMRVLAWIGAIPLFFYVAASLLYVTAPALHVTLNGSAQPLDQLYQVESVAQNAEGQTCLDLLHIQRALRPVPVCVSLPSDLPKISVGDNITVRGASGGWGQIVATITNVTHAGIGL